MPGGFEAALLLAACFSAAAFSHRLTAQEEGWLPPPPTSVQGGAHQPPQETQQPFSVASQMIVQTTRDKRVFDVPQIECPTSAEEDVERFACPTPDRMGRYRCINDHVLCDGFIDCPSGEDEDRQACMFYRTTKAHLDILADALLRWARGR
ncbi:uncharacterized protein LOC106666430 [Cimex lectularius]|uniref:Uncharacterized protein n=1 Tax=Cimex lectularius TaxID=79782 RepID=A0A8I6THE1_CIMLE|nr:uncharacterized protein LOC106666430 [Cimex lectularius]